MRLFPQPTPEQLAQRRAALERIRARRAEIGSIAPLTAADLVHLGRAAADEAESQAFIERRLRTEV